MAEKIAESQHVEPESQDTPSSVPSGKDAESQSSQVAQDASRPVTMADLEDFRKSLQSRKDKGISNLEKQVAGMSEQIAKYEAYRAKGLDPAQAEREMKLDALLDSDVREVPTQEPQGSGEAWGAALDGIFSKTGLDRNDPQVLELTARYGNAPPELLAELSALAVLKAKSEPTPSPGSVVTPTGSGATTGNMGNLSTDELGAQLLELSVSPYGKQKQIDSIVAELNRREPQRKL